MADAADAPLLPTDPEFGRLFDELPLWSAPFGLQLLERVPLGTGLTILDVGAGTGFLTLELAQRCGAGTRVIAVDPWPAAARRLRWKLDQLGLGNVEVLERDAVDTGLADESVDVLVSNLGLNNFEDSAAVLAELARVARPGASFILTSNVEGHMAELYEVFGATLARLGQQERLEQLAAHTAHRGSVDSITRDLAAAGFSTVDSVDADRFCLRYADGRALLNHWFIRLGFLDGWRAIADPERVDETMAALERDLDDLAALCGELRLTIPSVCVVARRDQPAG